MSGSVIGLLAQRCPAVYFPQVPPPPSLSMFAFVFALLVSVAPADSTASARTLARMVAEHEQHRLAKVGGILNPGGGLPDLSAARVMRDAERARGIVRQLDLLVPKELTAEEWTTSRMIRFDLVAEIEDARFYDLSFAFITPYLSPLAGIPLILGARPLATAQDVARYLAMIDSLPAIADTIRGALESRRARKVLLPKDEVRLVVPLLRNLGALAGQSPFAVAPARLSGLAPDEQTRFLEALAARLNDKVRPAFQRLADWVEGPYLAEAPDAVGLGQYQGGAAYYRALVKRHTTLDVTPEQVHAIGLAEVARLDSAMAQVRGELGFTGTKAEFHARLAKDPRFFAKTPEEFGEKLMYHDARIRPRVGDYFSTMPRAQGDVQRLDPRLEASMTFGYYQVPTPGDTMGHYMFNGSDLPDRSMLGAAALIFHELVPGHHFQIALQREQTTMPGFRRQATGTAFVEGWGEYASTLAGEIGMYSDPWDRYGRLSMDIFLACRLVVDTGMNALGWSRARAQAYMKEYTLHSDRQIDTETLRYSADMPGQALAYKMGSREFLRMREEARRRLGSRFDIKRFHAFVLSGGAMPFTLLRQRLEQWIVGGGV